MAIEKNSVPAISAESPGNLGNALIRFIAISNAARALGNAKIGNFTFPHWNIHCEKIDSTKYKRIVLVDRDEDFQFQFLRADFARTIYAFHCPGVPTETGISW